MPAVDPLVQEISILHECNRLCTAILAQFDAWEQLKTGMLKQAPQSMNGTLGSYRMPSSVPEFLNILGGVPNVGGYGAAGMDAVVGAGLPPKKLRPPGASAVEGGFPYDQRGRSTLEGLGLAGLRGKGAKLKVKDVAAAAAKKKREQREKARKYKPPDFDPDPLKQPPCQIYNCDSLSEPCKRKLKLCTAHKRAQQVQLTENGPMQRYCRYCHVLHDLDAFPKEDVRTICVRRNELRLKRSRERRKEIRQILLEARRTDQGMEGLDQVLGSVNPLGAGMGMQPSGMGK